MNWEKLFSSCRNGCIRFFSSRAKCACVVGYKINSPIQAIEENMFFPNKLIRNEKNEKIYRILTEMQDLFKYINKVLKLLARTNVNKLTHNPK